MRLYRRLLVLAKTLLSRAAVMPRIWPVLPQKLPLENSKLHFPLIFQSIYYKLGKYFIIYFPKQWAAFWTIQFSYTHRETNGITYICPWYSQHAPSSPRLYFIISYVDATCLWNIKMTITGTILDAKQKVIWSSAHQ